MCEIKPEEVLERVGADNYRVEGNRVWMMPDDWVRVAEYLDAKITPGSYAFYAAGLWWFKTSEEGLKPWEETVEGYDP